MPTINASVEAAKKVMLQRHKMEEESGRVTSTAEALDVLLGVRKEDV